MALDKQEVARILNQLIQTAEDGAAGYQQAAEGASDSEIKAMLGSIAREREHFSQELRHHVSSLGEEAEDSGSVAGAAHRGWINLKSAITGRDDTAILKECAQGDKAAIDTYQEALDSDLPGDVRAVIARQHGELVEAYQRVEQLQGTMAG